MFPVQLFMINKKHKTHSHWETIKWKFCSYHSRKCGL